MGKTFRPGRSTAKRCKKGSKMKIHALIISKAPPSPQTPIHDEFIRQFFLHCIEKLPIASTIGEPNEDNTLGFLQKMTFF